MTVPTTIDIPAFLYEELHVRAEGAGTSIGALIVDAIRRSYGAEITGPLVIGNGQLGIAFPVDENPHDLVFS